MTGAREARRLWPREWHCVTIGNGGSCRNFSFFCVVLKLRVLTFKPLLLLHLLVMLLIQNVLLETIERAFSTRIDLSLSLVIELISSRCMLVTVVFLFQVEGVQLDIVGGVILVGVGRGSPFLVVLRMCLVIGVLLLWLLNILTITLVRKTQNLLLMVKKRSFALTYCSRGGLLLKVRLLSSRVLRLHRAL